MAKLWQFLQGHPKPAFSEKVQRGDQGNFFKNRQKGSPRFKGPRALLKFVSTNTAKTGEDFGAERLSKSARMAELWQISQGHPLTRIFLKKRKRGTKGNFSKIAQKVAFV